MARIALPAGIAETVSSCDTTLALSAEHETRLKESLQLMQGVSRLSLSEDKELARRICEILGGGSPER